MCNTEMTTLSGLIFLENLKLYAKFPSHGEVRGKKMKNLRAKKFIHFTHCLLKFSYMDID